MNLQYPPTPGQSLGMNLVRMIMSIPSLIGSMYIIQHILRSSQYRQVHHKKRVIFARIMLSMSTYDFFCAIYTLFAALAVPYVPSDLQRYPLAIGTWNTCVVSGFVGQVVRLTSILYNASLAMYYLLTIRYQYTDAQCKKLEPWFHIVPNVIGWSTAIASVPLTLFNPTLQGCVIVEYPLGCDGMADPDQFGYYPCVRGSNGRFYQIFFNYVWVWIVFLFLVWSMFRIHQAVVRAERILNKQQQGHSNVQSIGAQAHSSTVANRHRRCDSMDTIEEGDIPASTESAFAGPRDNNEICSVDGTSLLSDHTPTQQDRIGPSGSSIQSSSNQNISTGASVTTATTPTTVTTVTISSTTTTPTNPSRQLSQSKMFATQAYLYCSAFFVTWIFAMVQIPIVGWITGRIYVPLAFLNYINDPLQGFWNAIIYIRPRYISYRIKQRQQHCHEQQIHQHRLQAFLYAASVAAVADEDEDRGDDHDNTRHGIASTISSSCVPHSHDIIMEAAPVS